MADTETIQLLKKTPLFSELDQKELQALLITSKDREFSAGTTILKDGDSGNLGFYLITAGEVEVKKGENSLAKLGPGGFFGEMALLYETPRSADVIATQDTSVVMLTRWDLRALISTHPDIALKMMGEITKRLVETNKSLSE